MRVNVINYAMPRASRSVGVMSSAVAFGNVQESTFTPIKSMLFSPSWSRLYSSEQEAVKDEKSRLGLDILSGDENILISRESDHYSIRYNTYEFGELPGKLFEEIARKEGLKTYHCFANQHNYPWGTLQAYTEEGTQAVAGILNILRAAAKKLGQDIKTILK